jgi:hypothetical protein
MVDIRNLDNHPLVLELVDTVKTYGWGQEIIKSRYNKTPEWKQFKKRCREVVKELTQEHMSVNPNDDKVVVKDMIDGEISIIIDDLWGS